MVFARRLAARAAFLAGVSSFAFGVNGASAGSFGLHEQSAEALGESFAGVAAGAGGLSSMFWNPANLTQSPGFQTSTMVTLVSPRAVDTFTGTNPVGNLLGIGIAGSPGNNIGLALIPASYAGYQINDQLWAGVSVNTPFGAATKNPFGSAASLWGLTTQLFTIDITPELAYKINNWISVGFGVQAMYADARESQNIFLPSPPFGLGQQATSVLTGNSWGFGVTAGVTLTPVDGTQIGIGYRSQVSENLKGNVSTSIPSLVSVKASLTTPDSLSIGLKQRITPQINLLAGVEWTDWSRLTNITVTSTGTIVAPAPLGVVPGQTLLVQPLNYKDGWMFSLGGEYAWDPNLTLRAGLAYEQSPIDNSNRDVRILDANRVWASLGASYKVSSKLKFDVSYAHLFYQNGTIAIPATVGPPPNPATYNGSVSAHADIVSIGLTYRWDEPAVPALVAKY